MDLDRLRHSTAHIMAAAVCRLFKQVRLDIGPSTASGFYYDFDLPEPITPEHFPAIEAEMRRIAQADLPFERTEMTREAAERMLREAGQTYKVQRLADIPEGEPVSFYRCGEFIDLCRGPHLERTGQVKSFKLLNVAGSYFRGDEKNPMLQRIYGIAAESDAEIEAELLRLEEAKRRDHRKLGRELDLFSIQDDVGGGLIHWHPKAGRIRTIIEDFWRKEHFRNGYEILYTPHIGRAGLWQQSGHLDFFRESMYAPMEIDGDPYFAKPMNCPFHIQVFKSAVRSYRELPLRWAELGTVYRYEKAGVLHGLLRVRGFTQDDAHIICRPDQVEDEVKDAVRFALRMWRTFGFSEFVAYLATRPEKAVGEPERWERATDSLIGALRAEGIPFQTDAGGGAFYGPKIDMKVKDAIGREWQMTTVQFDFNLPDRFDMTYVGEDGRPHRPYMVHRALLGSLERFFGVLVEHYAGAFPLWLAPVQVRVLPLTEKQMAYGLKVHETLRARDVRVEIDRRSEKIGAKIRDAQLQKIPYMAIVGGKEEAAGTVSVRGRAAGDLGVMELEAFIARLKQEEESRCCG